MIVLLEEKKPTKMSGTPRLKRLKENLNQVTPPKAAKLSELGTAGAATREVPRNRVSKPSRKLSAGQEKKINFKATFTAAIEALLTKLKDLCTSRELTRLLTNGKWPDIIKAIMLRPDLIHDMHASCV